MKEKYIVITSTHNPYYYIKNTITDKIVYICETYESAKWFATKLNKRNKLKENK